MLPPAKKATRKAVATKSTARKRAPAKKRTAVKRAPAKKMTAQHKAALAAGRTEAQHVRAYLDALEANKPKRGRQRTPESIKKQLAAVKGDLRRATGMHKLELVARRIELENELAAKSARSDLSELRKNFVKYAGSYAKRKGIPKQAFREARVPAADIAAARIQ
jgi:hypothetical protein